MNDKNTEPLISIICPVYNVGKTVEKMIQSVLSQDYTNFQLIIVDDMSKDNTTEIIQRYAEADSRIVFVKNKENTGPGPAKNMALQLAEGEYITFIDGDDWIEKGAYSALMEKQRETEADVVVSGYIQDYLDANENIKYSVKVIPPFLNGNESTPNAFATLDAHKSFSFCTPKLYKSFLIKENNVVFPAIMHSEDFFFNMALLPYTKRTATVEKAFYHYIKPVGRTLTTAEYIPDYYGISNRRYEASKNYCISQGSFTDDIRAFIANTHIKHLSMCLIYNCAAESGLNHAARKSFVKEMLAQKNTLEAIKYCSENSRSSMLMNGFFKTKSSCLLLMFGRMMWIGRQKFPFLFDKLK